MEILNSRISQKKKSAQKNKEINGMQLFLPPATINVIDN
jgi:hypothetical protein